MSVLARQPIQFRVTTPAKRMMHLSCRQELPCILLGVLQQRLSWLLTVGVVLLASRLLIGWMRHARIVHRVRQLHSP